MKTENSNNFIGREKELSFLNKAYTSNKAELIVLYGRRRVGKTELLKAFCKDKRSIFYLCRKYTDEIQLQEFSKALFSLNDEEFFAPFQNWDSALSYLKRLESDTKLVLVIDEFPYACLANKSLPSVLQIAWDTLLKDLNVMIVLCGSSMSFIEDELLAEKNPLYGRATGIYKVQPMPYYDAVKFLPNFTDEEKLIALSILGGIPHYLKQFNSSLSLKENIIGNILSKGCVLYSEADFLLYQELRETSVYNTIIQYIALGSNSFNELMVKTQLEKSKLSVYLKKLIELNIVVKELPALSSERDKVSSSKGLYELTDNFFRFWFTFAYPNLGLLEMEDATAVWEDEIDKNLHNFASKAFEEICIEYMYVLNKRHALPFRFTSIARWWGKVTKKDENGNLVTNQQEIDLIATDSKQQNYILGECKFTNEPFDMGQLLKLQSKLTLFGNIYYYLFSLNGFTDAVINVAKQSNNLFLVTPKDILSV
jgi:hypothetical protein